MTTLLDVQGRRTVGYLTNKTGGAVAKGDVVILDSANDEAFTTSTSGAEVVGVGVAAEAIANNVQGRVVFQGYVELITVNASVTRGHFGKTHTVAKQAVDAGASRVLGVFCEFLTGGTTPTAMLFGQPDGVTGAGGLAGGTPALTFSTSNAAGSAGSGIRTDATLALFDATVPVSQAIDDAAAAGSAGVAARRDHRHGMPAFVGCSVANSALQTISHNTGTALTFDTETSPFFDVGNVHSGTDFTATSAGKWYMHCSVHCAPAASGIAFLGVAINGSEVTKLRRRNDLSTGGAGQIFAITTELILAINDVVTFLAFQNSGGNLNFGADAFAIATFRKLV